MSSIKLAYFRLHASILLLFLRWKYLFGNSYIRTCLFSGENRNPGAKSYILAETPRLVCNPTLHRSLIRRACEELFFFFYFQPKFIGGIVKEDYLVMILGYFFLLLHKNICCGYSLEVPHRGTSNEYPQHMFLWRKKKNYPKIVTN